MKNLFTSHGYLTLSNHGGLEIEINNSGDAARLSYYGKVSRWQEIKYNFSGSPYVTYYGRRWQLDQFMRAGFGCSFASDPYKYSQPDERGRHGSSNYINY